MGITLWLFEIAIYNYVDGPKKKDDRIDDLPFSNIVMFHSCVKSPKDICNL